MQILKKIIASFKQVDAQSQNANTKNNPEAEALYKVTRGAMVSPKLATTADVEEFLRMCGIAQESAEWEAAFAGWPLHVDGADMRFELQTNSSL